MHGRIFSCDFLQALKLNFQELTVLLFKSVSLNLFLSFPHWAVYGSHLITQPSVMCPVPELRLLLSCDTPAESSKAFCILTWWLLVASEVSRVQYENERRQDSSLWGCRAAYQLFRHTSHSWINQDLCGSQVFLLCYRLKLLWLKIALNTK